MGSEHYIGPADWLPYTIRFENVTNATAPAQEVLVVDSLDPSLDWSSVDKIAASQALLPRQIQIQCDLLFNIDGCVSAGK